MGHGRPGRPSQREGVCAARSIALPERQRGIPLDPYLRTLDRLERDHAHGTARDGWLAGYSTTNYYAHTTNGGLKWVTTSTKTTSPDLSFLNPSDGWLSLSRYADNHTDWTFEATTNGGRQWKPVSTATLPQASFPSAPYFLNPKVGWDLNENGPLWHVLHTVNGGRTWKTISPVEGGAGVLPFGVTFLTPQHGYVLIASTGTGSNGVLNMLTQSTNGGRTWSLVKAFPKPYAMEHVDFESARFGWALGPVKVNMLSTGAVDIGTELFRTTDGGATWTMVYKSLPTTLADMVFVTPSVGYASATHAILKTVNGGKTWKILYRDPRVDFQLIFSLNQY
jgi:photosystem II stability/assembly factor-like uncharacterized protein